MMKMRDYRNGKEGLIKERLKYNNTLLSDKVDLPYSLRQDLI